MTVTPIPFEDEFECERVGRAIYPLVNAARELDMLHRDTMLAAHRAPDAAAGVPTMPTLPDIIRAQEVLEQVAACISHIYEQRRRPGDPDILLRYLSDDIEDAFDAGAPF